MPTKYYAAIDLKSFYASVECNERGLDPLTTNLVVADSSRTEKTICLAVSPSLKSYGLPGRARLFEVIEKVREINADRQKRAPLGVFLGQSSDNQLLQKNPNLALDYIVATPRMKYYLDYSARIYNVYLRHIAPEDIYAYSIDEVFCDITSYLNLCQLTPSEFITKIISDIHRETGITATAGIGTNMFLAKVAMDILAKHAAPNSAGVRIAKLDEQSFREQLWTHQPITDFWRVGRGSPSVSLTAKSIPWAISLVAPSKTKNSSTICSASMPNYLLTMLGVMKTSRLPMRKTITPRPKVSVPDKFYRVLILLKKPKLSCVKWPKIFHSN